MIEVRWEPESVRNHFITISHVPGPCPPAGPSLGRATPRREEQPLKALRDASAQTQRSIALRLSVLGWWWNEQRAQQRSRRRTDTRQAAVPYAALLPSSQQHAPCSSRSAAQQELVEGVRCEDVPHRPRLLGADLDLPSARLRSSGGRGAAGAAALRCSRRGTGSGRDGSCDCGRALPPPPAQSVYPTPHQGSPTTTRRLPIFLARSSASAPLSAANQLLVAPVCDACCPNPAFCDDRWTRSAHQSHNCGAAGDRFATPLLLPLLSFTTDAHASSVV